MAKRPERTSARASKPSPTQKGRAPTARRRSSGGSSRTPSTADRTPSTAADRFPSQPPPFRRLRTYAFDPSFDWQLDTAVLNAATLQVLWEPDLLPGPVGEYLEVVDYDPASGGFYAPVNLNDPHLLAQDGLAPSEGNPQFHQQMVYAVAMTTIRNFERALGRRAMWSFYDPDRPARLDDWKAMRRLRIYPHALREANAYYSPSKGAVLFGYFPASASDPGRNLPGGMVFTCLSHDVIVHEVTHALLDGLHRRYIEPCNPDSMAFHEAFADIVALFQHFTFPESVRHEIAQTRGDLARQGQLAKLAVQFGQAIGQHGALRDAIGRVDSQTGEWRPHTPDPEEYRTVAEPHARGAILVAAVFDAFLTIYKARIADLLRIATGGTGVLPGGELHPDLVNRLADEANKAAGHVLRMCIRALDYCPPVAPTFGDYLRALVTADTDLVPDDRRGYRVAFVEAFRRRGIYPQDVRSLSVANLCWQPPEIDEKRFAGLIVELRDKLASNLLDWDVKSDRKKAFEQSAENRKVIHGWLVGMFSRKDYDPGMLKNLGLSLDASECMSLSRSRRRRGELAIEVHSVRPARRIGPDGEFKVDLVVEITQRRRGYMDPADQAKADKEEFIDDDDRKNAELGRPPANGFWFRGGSTLLIDMTSGKVRYCIAKNILSKHRLEQQRRFFASPEERSLTATYFGDFRDTRVGEPFALLHSAV